MIKTLLLIELLKIFKRGRTYIGFAAIGLVVPLIQWAMYWQGETYLKMVLRPIEQQFVVSGHLLNGYLLANLMLNALFLHIPFLIVLVSGDLLAGEATAGTYRFLLVRPLSRWQLVSAKWMAGWIYTALLLSWMALLSLGVSVALFGGGDLIHVRKIIYVIPAQELWWRFLLAYGYGLISMGAVMTLSFFFSALVENAIGPIIGTLAVLIVMLVIAGLPLPALQVVQPYLLTSYLNGWVEFLKQPLNMGEITRSLVILLAFNGVMFGATAWIMQRKDILT